YDEPTTGLDPARAEQIQDLVHSVHGQLSDIGVPRTSIIVTHDTALLYRLAPRIIMLHEGRVYFDGPTQAFEHSDKPAIQPYLAMMPGLHARDPDKLNNLSSQ
ncbi:MAG TPA: hypothetical protein VL282_11995, partial [Tepidisphaeraceae bacterium]|nr:hypothetical protein [Tepidisphaeraceae bacterium]